MLTLSRYNQIREEIFRLYNILNNRLYPVRVTPVMMMTVDQLRNRETFTRDDAIGDPNLYEDYQEIQMECHRIIKILPNLVKERDLGFAKPNDHIVEIFESAQNYLRLWVELVTNATEFRPPPLDELRDIEALAYCLYPEYKKIKQYLLVRDSYLTKEDQAKEVEDGFMSLAALFGMMSPGMATKDPLDFISHLEGLGIDTGRSTVTQEDFDVLQSLGPVTSVNDGLFAAEAPTDLPNWSFNR
jgi:hypothetical protein